MAMANCTEVRPGNAFLYEGQIYICINIDLNKTAMAKMKVKIKSKNAKTGNVLDLSFIGGDKVEILRLEKKQMQYLYDDGTGFVFMDNGMFKILHLCYSFPYSDRMNATASGDESRFDPA